MDNGQKHDLELLNALVDGELGAADRAELAARLAVERDLAAAHATLARLKATVAEMATDCPPVALPRPRRLPFDRRIAAVAAAVLLAIGALLYASERWLATESFVAGPAEGPTAITLASLPAGTTIPRLDTAGLKLISLAFNPGSTPLLTASYRGPHGCRVDLRAWTLEHNAPAMAGTSLRRWTAGDLVYELVAHGMPAWRFAIIADAAEQQTRLGTDPDRIDRRLREANRGAPPCLG